MWKLRLISANELKPSQAQVPLFAVIAHIARKLELKCLGCSVESEEYLYGSNDRSNGRHYVVSGNDFIG